MLNNNMTEAEKTKKRIRGRRICPFEVAKDEITP